MTRGNPVLYKYSSQIVSEIQSVAQEISSNMDHRRAIPVKLWVLFLGALLVQAIVPVNSYNILMVFTSHSKSHLIIASSLLKGLAEEGHNVRKCF